MKEDMFMWKTICDVLPQASEIVKEKIYEQLEGTTWSIKKIEKLYSEME